MELEIIVVMQAGTSIDSNAGNSPTEGIFIAQLKKTN